MDNEPAVRDRGDQKSSAREELRTISFRLRELQRLLGMRVVQENRRLEAEGIAPVEEADFFWEASGTRPTSPRKRDELAEALGGVGLDGTVRVRLVDGTTIEGRAGPIDYTPGRRLRIELEPPDGTRTRYELKSEHGRGGWDAVRVRRCEPGDENWIPRGEVASIL